MTNSNIAKLYLATNTAATATEIDAAIADGSADTAVTALTGTALLNAIYQASFGRDADAEGLAYWGASTLTGDALVTAINAGAAVYVANDAYPENVAIAANDAVVVVNKATAEASAANITAGEAATAISTVTEVASTVTAAQGTISTYETAANVTNPDAQLLTTSSDLITGTTGDDSINAYVGTITATGTLADTLQSVDIIDGGAGVDTLNISLSTQGNAPGATIANVENINYTEYAAVGLNMANTTGVTNLNIVNSIGTTAVSNLAENVAVTVSNTNVGTTVGYTGATLNSGVADALSLTISNVGNSSLVTLNHATTTNDYETINMVTAGSANDAVLAGTAVDAATTLNITGDQSLKLGATALTTLKTVDASGTTGGVNLDVTGASAQNMTVTGGTGDDTLIIAGLSNLDTIDGGDGADTLVARLTGDVATAAAITNVEVVSLSASTASSINLENATSLTNVIYAPATADVANLVSVTNAAATATGITISGSGITTAETHAGAAFALKTSTATTDALTISIDNVTAAGVHTPKADGTVLTVTSITANGIEDISINTADLGATLVSGATTTVGGVNIGTLNATSASTVSITSDSYVSIGNAFGATVKSIDASAASAGVNLNIGTIANSTATGTASTSVTTGAGNDTLGTMGTVAAVNMTLSTGAGKDTVTIADNAGLAGIVTIDMGAGDDTVTGAATTAAATAAGKAGSTLAFGEGTDTLKSGAADTDLTNYTITGLEKVQILSTLDVSVNAADVTGTVIELSDFDTGYLELVGTTGADSIDASSFVINGAAGVVVNGAGGADTLSGTTGIDAFSLAAHTLVSADIDLTEVSTITNFEAQDFLTFGGDFAGATPATSFSTGTVVDITAAGNATFIAALNAALLADTSGGAKEGHVFSVTSSDDSVTDAVGSYAVFNTGTDTAFTSGADFIVKITGTLPAAANDFDVA